MPEPFTYVYLEDGQRVPIPLNRLIRDLDGGYSLLHEEANAAPVRNPLDNAPSIPAIEAEKTHRAAVGDETVIPVIEETAHVAKREVEKGRVAITKVVDEKHQVVDMPLMHEEAHIERVPVGQFVDAVPGMREENGILIIPLVEEVIVMEKRLYVKEELRVSKSRGVYRNPQTVTVRSERAVVTREQPQEPGVNREPSNSKPTG
jgi:uncharacterized protein (TIGR02271 family)